MIQELQNRDPPTETPKAPPLSTIKFGSFNVNGLNLETGWAVQQLLTNRGFNVRQLSYKKTK